MEMQVSNIIWTRKELENWHAKHPLKEWPPLAVISASKLSESTVKAISRVQGTISNIIVYFPPGSQFVSVSLSLNDITLIPRLIGDDLNISFSLQGAITKGDIVKVIVQNDDEKWDHLIGTRVYVDEDKR